MSLSSHISIFLRLLYVSVSLTHYLFLSLSFHFFLSYSLSFCLCLSLCLPLFPSLTPFSKLITFKGTPKFFLFEKYFVFCLVVVDAFFCFMSQLFLVSNANMWVDVLLNTCQFQIFDVLHSFDKGKSLG